MLGHIMDVHINYMSLTTTCVARECDQFGRDFELDDYRVHLISRHPGGDWNPHFPSFPNNVCYNFRCDRYGTAFVRD